MQTATAVHKPDKPQDKEMCSTTKVCSTHEGIIIIHEINITALTQYITQQISMDHITIRLTIAFYTYIHTHMHTHHKEILKTERR